MFLSELNILKHIHKYSGECWNTRSKCYLCWNYCYLISFNVNVSTESYSPLDCPINKITCLEFLCSCATRRFLHSFLRFFTSSLGWLNSFSLSFFNSLAFFIKIHSAFISFSLLVRIFNWYIFTFCLQAHHFFALGSKMDKAMSHELMYIWFSGTCLMKYSSRK